MLKVRVIPCLDVAGGRVVKGVNFRGLVDAGDPVEAAAAYDAAGADELCFLDIGASAEERENPPRSRDPHGGARLHAPHRGRRRALGRGRPPSPARRGRQGQPQLGRRGAPRRRGRGRPSLRRPMRRRGDRRQGRGTRPMGDLHPWRPTPDRHRRGGLRPRGGRARGGGDPAHLDGPRRHARRLRSGAHPRGGGSGAGAGDRLGRRRHAGPPGGGRDAGAAPRRSWPPRSSTSDTTRSPRQRHASPRRASRFGRSSPHERDRAPGRRHRGPPRR